VVPYLVRHPGASVAEVTRLFNISERELLSDLNLLFVSGLPPYGPGDLIDVDIDEGRIWIRMADYFSRPLRLTRREALALYLRGNELLGAPGLPEAPALQSALAKLQSHLDPELPREASGRVEAAEGGRPADTLERIRRAISESDGLEIEYYSGSRDETSVRRIDPEEVFSALGNWYVVAWDHSAEDERTFRADRIKEVRETGEQFEPRGLAGAGRPLYTRSREDIRVRIVLKDPARWVAEYYEVERTAERDGEIEVVLPTKQLAWVAKLLLRLGGQARVLGPEELREHTRELARKTLLLYA
jgi:proteasome accessory factor C